MNDKMRERNEYMLSGGDIQSRHPPIPGRFLHQWESAQRDILWEQESNERTYHGVEVLVTPMVDKEQMKRLSADQDRRLNLATQERLAQEPYDGDYEGLLDRIADLTGMGTYGK